MLEKLLQKQLHQRQQGDAGKPQKSGDDHSYGIDRKVKACKGCHGVQQPQAAESAGGVDAQFPEPANGQHHDPEQGEKDQRRNKKGDKNFHDNLRISAAP